MGVHTRLTDEVEEWKIKRTLEMVREWARRGSSSISPGPMSRNSRAATTGTHSDLVIDHANRQGLQVIARLGYVPQWARPPDTSPLYLDEDRFADFGRLRL
jgi:hypothetical protein